MSETAEAISPITKALMVRECQRRARTLIAGHQLMCAEELDNLKAEIEGMEGISKSLRAMALSILSDYKKDRKNASYRRAAASV